MVEVFITNVHEISEAERVLEVLKSSFPGLGINFDLAVDVLSYPCKHSILRVEGATINDQHIVSAVRQAGFQCDILEDKLCN